MPWSVDEHILLRVNIYTKLDEVMVKVINRIEVFEKWFTYYHQFVALSTELILVDSKLAFAFSLEKI